MGSGTACPVPARQIMAQHVCIAAMPQDDGLRLLKFSVQSARLAVVGTLARAFRLFAGAERARECLDLWTGKQSFQSFKDPSSGEKVEVFSSPNATVSILELISDPEGATSKRLIKIQHPDLKKKLGFTIWSHYFSMDELQLQAETLRALYDKAVGKPSSQRGPLDRAVLT